MESSQARVEFLEQSILNLRQELEAQAALAEKELSGVDQTLRKMMEEHQQLETMLRTMERQLLEATQESETRRQELRDRDYELAQLKALMVDREREIESMTRRLKAAPVTSTTIPQPQANPPAPQPEPTREISISVTQLLLVGVVALFGSLLAVLVSRQFSAPSTEPSAIEAPRN